MDIRKRSKEEVKIVSQKDNYMIIQEKNKKKIGEVYPNRKVYEERWKN